MICWFHESKGKQAKHHDWLSSCTVGHGLHDQLHKMTTSRRPPTMATSITEMVHVSGCARQSSSAVHNTAHVKPSCPHAR
jgi:hypothetical protein